MAKNKQKKRTTNFYIFFVIVCASIAAYYLQGHENANTENEEVTQQETTFQEEENNEQASHIKPDADSNGKNSSKNNTSATNNKNTKLEIPAPLTDRNEQILYRTGYTVSYNAKTKIPNWVAWELTPARLNEVEQRTDEFLPDPDIPYQEAVTTYDYIKSGFDRGHMCPAGDNKWKRQAMIESFYMTNICPQDHELNRGDWNDLEIKCRRWARKEGKIYIVCGPIIDKGKQRTIGNHKVAVPNAFFKVVLTMGKQPRGIGFIYKNTSEHKQMSTCVRSIDEVERLTGIDFFPTLPDEIESSVEAMSNLKDWP